MQFQPGQYIKIIFYNNTHAEGIIETYSELEIILISKDNTTKLFITPIGIQDIMAVEVLISSIQQPLQIIIPKEEYQELEQKLDEELKQPFSNLKVKNLAQLKTLMAQQEKQIVSQKLKEYTLGNIKPITYKNPFLK